MFTDLVGSTELSLNLDVEDLREVLRTYQGTCAKLIEQYGGFVARYMGDGIMCYFGYPQAHEDDAERCIRAGLEIIEAIRELRVRVSGGKKVELAVRVGIASGIVVVGDLIGEGASEERAVVGDTPNLAARMQTLAEPNTLVIESATFRLSGHVFTTVDLGMQMVKGSRKPMRTWQVVRPRNAGARFKTAWAHRTSPLIGRDVELGQLGELWRTARSGQGQVALLSGEPGLGKSRIASRIYSHEASEATYRLRYQCTPLHSHSALYPFIEQLKGVSGITNVQEPREVFAKICEFLQRFEVDDDENRALMAWLLSAEPNYRYAELNLGAQQLKQRTIAFMGQLMATVASRGSLLIVFEDMHWADPSSLELLEAIVVRAASVPSMLICTHRPEHNSSWLVHSHVTQIDLQRLDQQESERILDSLLGSRTFSARLKREILEKTDGIPLFVEEMARVLIDDKEKSESAAESRLTTIPNTLQSSLMSRLDHLGTAKATAQTGAAIGRVFQHELLEKVVADPGGNIDTNIAALTDDGLVDQKGAAPHSVYTFRHGLFRDVAYQSLLRNKRREIHARIAHSLEQEFANYTESHPEILAHHLTEANNTVRAIEYWEAAARKSMHASANVEAEHHFRRAVDLLRTLPADLQRAKQELGLLTAMGAVLINNHGAGSTAVNQTYERCQFLCEEIGSEDTGSTSTDRFATLWGLWRTCESLSVAMNLVEQMRMLGEREQRPDLIMQAHHSGWATLFNLGKLQRCLDAIQTGEPLYDGAAHRHHASIYGGHDPQVCAHGVGAVALCLSGWPQQGEERIRQGIEHARSLDHPGSLAHALDFSTTFYRICDDAAQTLDSAQELVRYGAEHAFADYEIRGRAFRGWATAKLGDGEAGLDELRASMLANRESGTSEDFPLFLEMLAEVCALVGRPDEGLIAIEEALQDTLRSEADFWLPAILRRRASLLIQVDESNRAEAIATLENALSVARAQGARLHALNTALDLARLSQPAEGQQPAEAARENSVLVGTLAGEITEGLTEPFQLQVMRDVHVFLQDCENA